LSPAFAAEVEAHLEMGISSATRGALFADLQNHVLDFPRSLGASAASKCEEIDAIGTSLWNITTRLRRNYELDGPTQIFNILLCARVFAFQLLDSALESSKKNNSNMIRLMKIGLKAAKNCLGESPRHSSHHIF
jgi:hypothetical protein